MKFSLKKNIIIIVAAAVLAIGAGAIAIGVSNSPANRISRYMGAAEHCLSELNYEQANIEFDRILEIAPMNVEAYLGKAQAYLELGNTENALEWLEMGLEMTGDSRLQDKIDEINSKPETPGESSSRVPVESEPAVASVTILGEEYDIATTTRLNLYQKSINDDVLKEIAPQLAKLTNLKVLLLGRNEITDLSPLANLTNLTSLQIDYNQISDISPLAKLTNLTELWLSDNQITDADVDRLKQQLPNCEISF